MRPKVPLISKRRVCEVALEIIDQEGIDALSIRRLADRIGVNGASLYHHFESKEDILAGAALAALSEVRIPTSTDEDWKLWFLRNILSLKTALEKHPDLIPILIRRNALRIGLSEIDSTFALLEAQGLPIGMAWTLMESLEALVMGTVMRERGDRADDSIDVSGFDHLQRATDQRILSHDEAFLVASRALIDGVDEAAKRGRRTEPRGRARRPAAGSNGNSKALGANTKKRPVESGKSRSARKVNS
jgi:TetR/AcrR family transcriptional regulator, tetracycline repressor protein